MKDYSSRRPKSTQSSIGARIKLLVQRVVKITFFVLIGLLVLSLAGWLFLPRIIQLHQPFNLVLVKRVGDRLEAARLVYLRPQENEVVIEHIEPDQNVSLVASEEVRSFSLAQADRQYLLDADQAKSREEVFFSWALERKINLVVETTKLPDHAGELSGLLRKNLFSPTLSLFRQMYFFCRQAEELPLQAYTSGKNNLPLLASWADKCSVAVLNSTSISGLAAKYSRILENSGVKVIRVDSYQPEAANSQFFWDSGGECGQLGLELAQIMPQPAGVNSDYQLGESLLNRYRADVVVVLGRDVSETR
ncbi:MAG: hypothetical protein GF381_01665 [Candidatus Pacebacteria bacterium]|nr:hypothetical protein [Candidatus Paceibacterota bacterium]